MDEERVDHIIDMVKEVFPVNAAQFDEESVTGIKSEARISCLNLMMAVLRS